MQTDYPTYRRSLETQINEYTHATRNSNKITSVSLSDKTQIDNYLKLILIVI